jgi:hypothetical protein
MRYLSRCFVIAVGLLAIGLASSAVHADEALAGKFKLTHSIQWDNTMLPAGDYTFSLSRTQSKNLNLLEVRGAKRKVSLFVRGEWSCETCQHAAIYLSVQGDHYAATSVDMAGFHANIKVRQLVGLQGEELAKTPATTEQIAVHVNPN